MPELPEVETIARGLAGLVGAEIADVALGEHDWVTSPPPSAEAHLLGRRIADVRRHGKRLSLRLDPEGFSTDELEDWILRANLMGGTVKNTVMSRELRQAHDEIRREVDRIAEIQKALLPSSMPEITGVRLAASYETFDRAGGDYYDLVQFRQATDGAPDPDGPWCLIVADASGHGPAAAVVMAMLQAVLHAYPTVPQGPAEVLEHVNRHLHAKRIESSFVIPTRGIMISGDASTPSRRTSMAARMMASTCIR